jgi:hypothetical protein
VQGTHRRAAEIQLLQQLADAALIQMNMEFGGDAVTPVGPAPAHDAVAAGGQGGADQLAQSAHRRCQTDA